MFFPIVADQPVLTFPGKGNDPITYANFQHIKGILRRKDLTVIRPDERGIFQKLWDWCCLGHDYNEITRDADQTLWLMQHGENDKLDLFEHLRDQVTIDDRDKFVYLSLDRDVVRFSLNEVDDVPIHFTAAPQGVPAAITANLWHPTALEQSAEARVPQGNLDAFELYHNASRPTRDMLNRLACPATCMAICRAIDASEPGPESTEMANPEMPEPERELELREDARRCRPRFTLSALQNGLIRADVCYATGWGRLEVSFLICEPRYPGAPVTDTLQCIYAKSTPVV
ncbi:hypothetical protein [Pandoraea oxalativorans]|uniref:Uncharacterized protein n=1 Tax=Pandoraea oxalativorans TaxID=573737 RepID=A0A0G3IC96_9BURK|nr:hypothetical protein [Pandoraea oxalativorans]AKK24809.1 hypothetical protein MB84_28935 [Pandoraea oxalativorans]